MQLKEWINNNHISMREFAQKNQCNYEDVRRYCAGIVIPRPKVMQKIVKYTKGEVTPNDFYNIDISDCYESEE